MPIRKAILKSAQETVNDLKAQLPRLQRNLFEAHQEQLEAERKTREIERKCQAASLAPNRLANFSVMFGADYLCPRCWIEHEQRSMLRPLPARSDGDPLVCHLGHEVLIPN